MSFTSGRTVRIRFLGDIRDLEAQMRAAGVAAEVEGKRIGDRFSEGTSKAASGLSRLSAAGASWGIPFSSSLDKIAKQLDEAHTRTQRLSTALAAAGKVTIAAGLAGFAGAAYEGVKGAMALQKQMEMLHTQAGASQAQVQQLTEKVLGMAGKVGVGPQELAQGMYHVVSSLNATLPAAQRVSDEYKVLKTAADGAKVGNANLVDVTNALDAAVVSGVKGVQNYSQAMGALNAIVGAGDMTMQDLADALSTGILGPMKTYGMSLRDVGAALATFGDNNMRGAEAATKLVSAVRIMAAPSKEASKYFEAIGLSTTQLGQDIRSGGLIKALEDLKTHLHDSGATAAQQGLIIARAFGGRQSTGVQVLLDQLDRVKAKYQEVGKGAHTFGADVAATHKTLAFQIDQLKATVQSLADKFGLYLIPKLQAVGSAVQSVIGWFEKHKAVAEALAGVITGVLGTAVSVYAYTKAAAFVGATRSMLEGVGKLVLGIGSAAVSIAGKFGIIDAAATTTATTVKADGAEIVASADATAAGVDTALGATGIGLVIVGLGVAVTELLTHWKQAMQGMQDAASAMVSGTESVLNGLIDAFNSTIGQITGQIGKLNTNGLNAAADMSRGPGGRDVYKGVSHNYNALGGGIRIPDTGSTWQRIAGALRNEGLSNVAIAGILGNFGQESGGQTITGINPGLHGASGLGFAQWIGSRRTAESMYAQGLGLNPQSLNAQIEYLIHELRTTYSNVPTALQGARSPQQAAAIFEHLFEGAGTPNMPARQRLAGVAYGMLTAGGGSISAGSARGINSTLAGLLGGAGAGHRTAAAATSAIPVAVATMLQTAYSLVGTQYTWGGGHNGWDPVAELKKIGVDCSGFVSQVLHRGGISLPGPMTTEGLASNLQHGRGRFFTVWDRSTGAQNQQHTLIDILGKWFESGGMASPNGVSQITAHQAAQELAGGGFNPYHAAVGGPLATMKQLRAMGLSNVSVGALGSANASFNQTLQALVGAITKAGESLIQRLATVIQSGTLRTLTSALGINTGQSITMRARSLVWGRPIGPYESFREPLGTALSSAFHGLAPNASIAQIDRTAGGLLNRGIAGSQQQRQFEQTVAQLIATGQVRLARELVAAHKAAIATLAQEMYAEQVTKDAEMLNLQNTEARDRLQQQQNTDTDSLNILKAQHQAILDSMAQVVTQAKDQTQIMQDIGQAMVQSIQDATQAMTDSLNSVAQGINDQTQIKVDILGERGLYGLHLVAQKLQVLSDETKAYWDQQISTAQQNLDRVTTTAHQQEFLAQLNLDQVKAAQDLAVSAAQQRDDLAHIKGAQMIAAAQAHLDAVQLSVDTTKIGPAQIAYDMAANNPRAQQTVYKSQLDMATAQGNRVIGVASQFLQGVTAAANTMMENADFAYGQAQQTAQLAIESANQQLVTVTRAADQSIASAQQSLGMTQGQAAVAEAGASGAVSYTQARASTQFAGSGLVVNMYNIPFENATAVTSSLDWFARNTLQLGQ